MTKFLTVQENVQKEKKETVFTHVFEDTGWKPNESKVDSFEKVIYLGNCKYDGDLFACYLIDIIEIFKGIKGDEFNQ